MNRRGLWAWAIVALAGIACAVLPRRVAQSWMGRRYLLGVDVSHHQGNIEWARVRDDGIAFAFLKASEGGDFVDSAFATHWRETRRVGLPRGAYHFFTFCKTGREQAANFERTVPVEDDALAPVVDLEFEGNCQQRPTPTAFRRELEAFLASVEQRYARRATLYFTHDVYARYGHVLPTRALFVRELFRPPGWLDRTWRLWQFNSEARVEGIEGPVDAEAFAGSLDELRAGIGPNVPVEQR
jgi:lysozyme